MAGFNGPSAGEPAPFDMFRGSDFGASFSESWTFNYGPGDVLGASLTIGIFDHDSMAAGSQIASFLVDGNDITGLLDAEFEAGGGSQTEYNIYSVLLPAAVLADLSDGVATFTLTLQGPGLQDPQDPTASNGAGLDFSRLDVRPVPEPSAAMLFGVSILFAARAVRRSRPKA